MGREEPELVKRDRYNRYLRDLTKKQQSHPGSDSDSNRAFRKRHFVDYQGSLNEDRILEYTKELYILLMIKEMFLFF